MEDMNKAQVVEEPELAHRDVILSGTERVELELGRKNFGLFGREVPGSESWESEKKRHE